MFIKQRVCTSGRQTQAGLNTRNAQHYTLSVARKAAQLHGHDAEKLALNPSHHSGFGGLEVACWPLVPKFAGSNPTEAVGSFRVKKSSARLPSEGK